MKSRCWLGSIIFIIVAVSLGGTQALAQTGNSASPDLRYFSETGHSVSGDFLKTYESATDPGLIYGYPITEAFEKDFRIIQYFERARFELRPENPPELRVVISPLGYLLHDFSPSLPGPVRMPGCQYIPEAGFYVCYQFLEFFNTHGGAAQFGYPISNHEIRGGRVVQYFQRARFEWHPELPSGQQVRLTDLGKEYFTLMGENPVRLLAVQPPLGSARINMVQELRVRGYFDNPVTHPSGDQTLCIILQDQKLDAVADAQITLEISLPSGQSLSPVTLTTNKYGYIEHTFSFTNQPPGTARVKVTAAYENLRKTTTVSYQIWH